MAIGAIDNMVDRGRLHMMEHLLRGLEENLTYWRSMKAVSMKAYRNSYKEAKNLRKEIKELKKKIGIK